MVRQGRVFICPIINTMGPVVDVKHADLLNTWGDIDAATAKYFTEKYRTRWRDSRGRNVVNSWFPVSWTGFEANPVKRDFGWFTIYDHLHQKFGGDLRKWGDGVYWMYNHPDKSRVGNVWGLDWEENAHYMEILAKMVSQRGFLPSVIQIPTANEDSSIFLEEYFPIELSNRNSELVNWDNIEADGKKTRDVLRWADAPLSWVPYHPSEANHQIPGEMKRWIFRLLDIKSRIITFPENEIIRAFEEASDGKDVVLSGYEHDFRDRSEAVEELFLSPIQRISKKYPKVEFLNSSLENAAKAVVLGEEDFSGAAKKKSDYFSVSRKRDYLAITSMSPLFSRTPIVVNFDRPGTLVRPHRVSRASWGIQLPELGSEAGRMAVGGFSVSLEKHLEVFDWSPDGVRRVANPFGGGFYDW